jgi:hypothetical protein
MPLQNTIKSYLYQQYGDDDAVSAFVQAYNIWAQNYLDTANGLTLPDYTQDPVSYGLLDWVAQGLYGFTRPVLPTLSVDDDIFRRVITWHFFKGDGLVFNIWWLKRRVWRFLMGTDGKNFNIDQTYRVSIITSVAGSVAIKIINDIFTFTGGSGYALFGYNEKAYNQIDGYVTNYSTIPEANVLQQAMQSGILETPFQFNFTVIQGGFVDFTF